MVEHHTAGHRFALLQARQRRRRAVHPVEPQPSRQLTIATDYQDRGQRFRPGRAQPHRTPVQTVKVLQLAARRIADLRFARFPQPQPANPRNRAPAAIGQLQIGKRFAIATALHRRTHPKLPRPGREQGHLRPLKRQQQRTRAAARDTAVHQPQHVQRRIEERRMHPVSFRRFRQRLRQHRTPVHRITDAPRFPQPLKRRTVAKPMRLQRGIKPRRSIAVPPTGGQLSSPAASLTEAVASAALSMPCACSVHALSSGASSNRPKMLSARRPSSPASGASTCTCTRTAPSSGSTSGVTSISSDTVVAPTARAAAKPSSNNPVPGTSTVPNTAWSPSQPGSVADNRPVSRNRSPSANAVAAPKSGCSADDGPIVETSPDARWASSR